MSVMKYDNLTEAYQSLTDLEIVDDKENYPCAIIKVNGIGKIKITMLSEWHYYNYFLDMQKIFLSYYASTLTQGEVKLTEKHQESIKDKINLFLTDLNSDTTKEGLIKKAQALTHLFDDSKMREYFFKFLKNVKVLPKFLSWKKYQILMRPIDTMTIFIFLWAFNVDGVKKNAKFLMEKISQATNIQSFIESKYSNDLESFKKAEQKAYLKFREKQSKNS